MLTDINDRNGGQSVNNVIPLMTPQPSALCKHKTTQVILDCVYKKYMDEYMNIYRVDV